MKLCVRHLSFLRSQESTFLLVFLFLINLTYAQQEQDSTKIEKLDEVLIKAIRVDAESPITYSNV